MPIGLDMHEKTYPIINSEQTHAEASWYNSFFASWAVAFSGFKWT